MRVRGRGRDNALIHVVGAFLTKPSGPTASSPTWRTGTAWNIPSPLSPTNHLVPPSSMTGPTTRSPSIKTKVHSFLAPLSSIPISQSQLVCSTLTFHKYTTCSEKRLDPNSPAAAMTSALGEMAIEIMEPF